MTEEATDLNPVPLVERLLEKSKAGKLGWEPTADRKAFVVSVGGESTFRIRLVQAEDIDMFGRPTTVDVPVLDMLDENGRTLWNIQNRDVPNNVLYRLYEVARRIGNRLDERLETTLDALERL